MFKAVAASLCLALLAQTSSAQTHCGTPGFCKGAREGSAISHSAADCSKMCKAIGICKWFNYEAGKQLCTATTDCDNFEARAGSEVYEIGCPMPEAAPTGIQGGGGPPAATSPAKPAYGPNGLPASSIGSQAICGVTHGPINNWRGAINFACPRGEVITRIQSVHDNGQEDRQWTFECHPADGLQVGNKCFMSHSANVLDKPMNFRCPNTFGSLTVLTGFFSPSFSTATNDRVFSFRCCEAVSTCETHCETTAEVNAWDQPMDFTVPRGKFLVGAESVHDNGREDRRWKFETCDCSGNQLQREPVNQFRAPISFECPENQAISRIQSYHDNGQEDRRWTFECENTGAEHGNCFESQIANQHDQPLEFQCPTMNGIVYALTGFHSEDYSGWTKDRTFFFTCCELMTNCCPRCSTGGNANEWDAPMDWHKQEGTFMAGAKSQHDNGREDRRWQFTTCSCQ